MNEFLKYTFIDNDSKKEYIKIIEEYRNKEIIGYYESHHILPKSLGGTNCPDNLIQVPLNVHYDLHRLLPEFTIGPDHYKMMYAYSFMSKVHNMYSNDIDFSKYNPALDPEIKNKISLSAKKDMQKRKENGWINPFTTDAIKEMVSKRATERNIKSNPMKNKEYAEKHNAQLRGRKRPDINTSYKVSSEEHDIVIVGVKNLLEYAGLGPKSSSSIIRFLQKGGKGNIGNLKNVTITRL